MIAYAMVSSKLPHSRVLYTPFHFLFKMCAKLISSSETYIDLVSL